MHIVIFGGTGRTGIPFIEQALAKGHTITAMVRTPAKLPIKHERLKVIQGDLYDAVITAQAIKGADAVVSAIGHTRDTPRDMMEVAAWHIINGMKEHNVKRLVALTGAGVDYPEKDQPKLINHVIKFALKTLSAAVLKDSEKHVEIIKHSGLDWTVVRVPRLTEGPHTGTIRSGYVGGDVGTVISRADVADYMLRVVEQGSHLQDMPAISG